MIERQFLGEVSLRIDGFDNQSLAEKICDSCKVISIYRRNDTVFLNVYGKDECKIKELAERNHAICEVLSRRGAVYTVRKYIKRWGVAFGAVITAVILFFMSNTVMKIEVKGASDPETVSEIKGILYEEGLRPGAYIPSINFLRLSSVLFSNSDRVSWASIGHTGSVVTVNVSEATLKSPSEIKRIPCNIVSERDAVIVGASVKVGRLGVLIGDAVYSGQLLVSGIIETEGGVTNYVHAYADIIGRYEDSAEFYQSFEADSTVEGKKLYRRAFKFFDLEIPLPGEVLDQNKEYSENSYETPVKFLDFTLPFSIKTYELTEITRIKKTYNPGSAAAELYKRLTNYEKNILKDVKIISRQVTESTDGGGVKLNVKYVLEGPIGRISEIFVK